MRPLVIASFNLLRLVRDRSNLFFVFVFPMVLVLLIGLAFGGGFEPELGVVADDVGQFGDELVERLEREDLKIEPYGDVGRLTDAVSRGFVSAGVVLPAGYSRSLRSGEVPTVRFVAAPGGTGQVLRASVRAAVDDQERLIQAARFALEEGVVSGLPAALAHVRQVAGLAPTVEVETTAAGEADPLEEELAGLGRFDLGASQQLLLFMFVTSLAGASALIQTRQLGVSRRMLSTPTSRGRILLGEALGRFVVALVQGGYIMVGSLLLFGVDWGDPLGAALLLVLFAAVSAGAAMLVGAVVDNDSQAAGMGVFAGLGLAAIGGCMAPLEVFPPTMRTVAHVTPHAWALEGFAELVREDGGVLDILPQLGVLAAFAAVLLGLASQRLHRAIVDG